MENREARRGWWEELPTADGGQGDSLAGDGCPGHLGKNGLPALSPSWKEVRRPQAFSEFSQYTWIQLHLETKGLQLEPEAETVMGLECH